MLLEHFPDYLETNTAERREFIHDLTLSWQELGADKSKDADSRFRKVVAAMQADEGLPKLLYDELASIDADGGWESQRQIRALLDMLAQGADAEQAKDVIALLGDMNSPLWQSKFYLSSLKDIGKKISAEQLASQVLDIAYTIAETPGEQNNAYCNHIGELAYLLLLVKNSSEDEEGNKILSTATSAIIDIRNDLRPYALAAVLGQDGDIESEEDIQHYAAMAFEEWDVLHSESDISTKNLQPMYYLKVVPPLTGNDEAIRMEAGYPQLSRRHQLFQLETEPHPLTPTIGIEIEVREGALLQKEPGIQTTATEQSGYTARKNQLKHRFESLELAGIEADETDTYAFHEFALHPKNYYLTLSREVQMLKTRGFIPKSKRPPVMHITLGGVTARLDDREESEAFALARIMEATMWSTSRRRLLRKYRDGTMGWDCKGLSGVLDKKYDEFYTERTTDEMVEFRTFQFKNLGGMNRTLASFQTLGAAMAAAQQVARSRENVAGDSAIYKNMSEDMIRLAAIWWRFEGEVKQLFDDSGLDNPKKPYTSPQPENDTKGRYPKSLGDEETIRPSGFFNLGKLLQEAEEYPESKGSEFVKSARKLVITTCGEITPIIYAPRL